MPQSGPIAFSGSPIDRADNLRADPDALAGMMNWKARLLSLEDLMLLQIRNQLQPEADAGCTSLSVAADATNAGQSIVADTTKYNRAIKTRL